MAQTRTTDRPRVADVIELYGRCLELVPMDPHFHNISVGLYVKDGTCAVWTYSRRPGADERIERIRDQMAALGGLSPVEGTSNEMRFTCGYLHVRPARFLLAQAVGKSPDYSPPEGELSIKDSKTQLMLKIVPGEMDGQTVYQVTGEGEHANVPARLRLVVAGFVRYGEMERLAIQRLPSHADSATTS